MNQPEISVGIAAYDDFQGVYFTVMALRMYHPEAVKHCRLVIVDNHPGSPDSQATKDFLGWVKGDFAKVTYVPYTERTGTSAPRQHIFDVAESDYVLVLDSHVLLVPGSLLKLLNYYKEHPNTKDLISGVMLYDDLKNYSSHMNDEWRSEMWGTWATDLRAQDPNAEPFEITAMGLGLFSCKKDAWLGFNPKFKGFGGEEWYIHEKFRKIGAKCLCLPFLRWVHRFGRPGGVKYPLYLHDKVKNYIIGHKELDLPLDRPKAHFLSVGMSEDTWNKLVAEVEGKTHITEIVKYTKQGGPGTELSLLLESLNVQSGPTCDCKAKAQQMDDWGIEGCKLKKQEIISWLREGQVRWGWKDKLIAASKAITTGLVFKLNPLDPFPGLVDESIRRAEEKANKPVLKRNTNTLVSVCMSTYNRITHKGRCVDEAVESFLRQTYTNKELIVCNDCPDQELVFNHVNVRVINLKKRTKCLAEKRNEAVNASSGELITNLDDDDLYLPWALEAMVNALGEREFIAIKGYYYTESNKIKQRVPSPHPNYSLYTRELFNKLNGYRVPTSTETDQDFIRRVGKEYSTAEAIKPWLLYRWGDGNYKLSGIAPKHEGDLTQWATVGNRPIQSGTFEIHPIWLHDYVELVEQFERTLQ